MRTRLRQISVFVAVLLLVGCGGPGGADGRTRVVTTIFPLYDFARQVAGDDDGVEITCLADGAADMHSFSPSSQDIVAIAECDVFVYVDGESDEWVAEVLDQHPNENRVVICCFDVLGGRLLAEDGAEGEFDEHVWLSLRNAAALTEAIADALEQAVPERAEAYAENAAAYVAQLDALDARYAQALAGGGTLLVADRFPFAYLANDYGLECLAAFSGCSAESEVSFGVVAQLADVLNQRGLTHIFVIDNGDAAVAEAVVAQAGADGVQVLSLCSMQAVSRADMEAGTTYLALMEENLEVLKEGLSR